jgi:hypothetical protein
MTDGHDSNTNSITSGIHNLERLHSENKENIENMKNHERWA